jgi:hypothetical protein
MGYDLFPHKSGIGLMEPVALIGHNVCVKFSNDNHYRRVIWFEPLPPFQFLNIGAVAAATTSNRTPATRLQVWRNEFAQFRWYPLDAAQVRLWLPEANGRFNLRNTQVPVDPTIVNRDPCLHMTEFFVWEDQNPSFDAISYTGTGITQCRLIGMGYRFVTEALPAADVDRIRNGTLQCTYVIASGFTGKT